VRQQLLRVPDVAKVELFGVQDEKLYIEISQKRLAQLGLDMNRCWRNWASRMPSNRPARCRPRWTWCRCAWRASSMQSKISEPCRSAAPRATSCACRTSPHPRGYADPPSIKVRHQGKEVIALGVSMTKGGDIIELGKSLKTVTDHFDKALPLGMKLVQVQDQPKAVANSVNEFVKVLIEAVAIVLAVSFLSLGLHKRPGQHPLWRRWTLDIRPGLVVGITIPLVLAMTFLAMHYWGIGLHKISLGSLIIALGLLVDDAIIAVEMMVRKMEEGYDKVRAATFAYELTAMPMLTGTLITAAGFLPIGIAKSMTGEYTFAIFAVTVIALVLSWIVSVYFVPYLGTLLLKAAPCGGGQRGKAHDEPHEMFDSPFYNAFRRLVNGACATAGSPSAPPLALFVPWALSAWARCSSSSSRIRAARKSWWTSGPEGTSFAANEEVAKRVEARLMAQPGVASGQHLGGFRRAAFLFAAGPDLSPEQRVAAHRAAAGPEGARIPAREAAGPAGAGVPGGARARQAAAQRPAGAVSGAVPRGRPRPAGAARARRRGQGHHARRARTREA
jgi:multidrug efflux pump